MRQKISTKGEEFPKSISNHSDEEVLICYNIYPDNFVFYLIGE